MKRYERMSKEEILDFYYEKLKTEHCRDCELNEDICGRYASCGEALNAWMHEEIKTKPRVATINTAEELLKTQREFMKSERGPHFNFKDWLAEEIEVNE